MTNLHVPRPLQFRMDPDGTTECWEPVTGVARAITPAAMALLSAIGRGAPRAEWEAASGLPAVRVDELIESFLASGWVADRAAAPSAEARASWPVFVVGCPGAGVATLGRALNAHPRVVCLPPVAFFRPLRGIVEYPMLERGFKSRGLTIEEIYGGLRALSERLVGEPSLLRSNKPRWADANPVNTRLIDFIDDVYEGQVLFLHLLRHPLDNVATLVRAWEAWMAEDDPEVHALVRRYGGNTPRACAACWADLNDRLRVFRVAHPDRAHAVRFEDLVRPPHAALGPLLAFLGETETPALAERLAEGDPHGGAGLPDEPRWRPWPAGERRAVSRVVAPVAGALGYDLPDLPEVVPEVRERR